MKYIKILAFAIAVILSACNKDGHEDLLVCEVADPLTDIDWLRDLKRTFDIDQGPQRSRISQYRYNGADVFLIESCYQCPDALSDVRDCEGALICEFGGIAGFNTCPDFGENATDEVVLYDE